MNIDLTVEEQQFTDRFRSQLQRMFTIYWISLIPTIMAQYLLDRFLSLIFKSNFSPFVEVLPYFPMWVAAAFLTFPFCFSWTWLFWVRSKLLGKSTIIIIWVVFLCFMGYLSEVNTPERLGLNSFNFYLILDVLILVLVPGTFILASLSKTLITKLIFVLGYIAAFAVVHWIFYLPRFADFTWAGIDTSWAATKDMPFISQMAPAIMVGVALIMMLVMLILSLKGVQEKLVMHEVKENRSKNT